MTVQPLGISDPWSIAASSLSVPEAQNGAATAQRIQIEIAIFLCISNPALGIIDCT
jgi:hypothetical protein